MALNVGELEATLRLRDELSDAAKHAVENVKNSLGTLGIAAGAAATIFSGVGAAIVALGSRGSTLKGVEDAFDRLALSAGTTGAALRESLSAGVKGTIDQMGLMQSAARLLSSGMKLTTDDAMKMGEAARAMGKATGTDAAGGLDVLNNALLTGRTRGLAMAGIVVDLKSAEEAFAKSLGVTVDQLNDAGKLEARRIAILEATRAYVDRLGVSEISFKERLQQGKVALEEWVNTLARAVDSSPNVLNAFNAISAALRKAFGGDSQVISDTIVRWINRIADAVATYGPKIIEWIVGIKDSVMVVWRAVVAAWDTVPDWFKRIAEDAALSTAALYLLAQGFEALSGGGGGGGGGGLLNVAANIGSVIQGFQSLGQIISGANLLWPLKLLISQIEIFGVVTGVSTTAALLFSKTLALILTPIGLVTVAIATMWAAWELGKTEPVKKVSDAYAAWLLSSNSVTASLYRLAAGVDQMTPKMAEAAVRDTAAAVAKSQLKDATIALTAAQEAALKLQASFPGGGPIAPVRPENLPGFVPGAPDPSGFLNTTKADEYNKKLKELLATMAGAGESTRLIQDAFKQLTQAQRESYAVQEVLIPEFDKLVKAGITLTAQQQAVYEAFITSREAIIKNGEAILLAQGITLLYLEQEKELGISEKELAQRFGVTEEAVKALITAWKDSITRVKEFRAIGEEAAKNVAGAFDMARKQMEVFLQSMGKIPLSSKQIGTGMTEMAGTSLAAGRAMSVALTEAARDFLPLTEAEKKNIDAMYQTGVSAQKMADVTGLSLQRIQKEVDPVGASLSTLGTVLSGLSTDFQQMAQIGGDSFKVWAREIGLAVKAGESMVKAMEAMNNISKPASQGGGWSTANLSALSAGWVGVTVAIYSWVSSLIAAQEAADKTSAAAARAAQKLWLVTQLAQAFKSDNLLTDQLNASLFTMQERLDSSWSAMGRLAAQAMLLPDIITALGGASALTSEQLQEVVKRLDILFQVIPLGGALSQDAIKSLDTTLVELGQAAIDATGLVSDLFLEMMRRASEAGIVLPQVNAMMKKFGEDAMKAFNDIASSLDDQLKGWDALRLRVDTVAKAIEDVKNINPFSTDQKDIDTLIAAYVALGMSAKDAAADLALVRQNLVMPQIPRMSAATITDITALGRAMVSVYGNASQAVRDAEAAFVQLKATGLATADELAAGAKRIEDAYIALFPELKMLVEQNQAIADNTALKDSITTVINGITNIMSAFNNAGTETVAMFQTQEAAALSMYSRMQGAVERFGGTTADALAPMQSYLRAARDEATRLGVPLDATLQTLIQQSRQLGLWKDDATDAFTAATEAANRLKDAAGRGPQALADAIRDQAKAAEEARPQLEALGTSAIAAFAAAIRSGKSFSEALAGIQPGLRQLRKAYQDLGITTNDAALAALFVQSSILENNPALITAIQGLVGESTALFNMGMLNADTFAAMERTGASMYSRLQGAAQAAGGTTRDALLPMQEWLRRAADEAARLNIPLDANTQQMIDQSKQLGIWQNTPPTAQEQMTAATAVLIQAVTQLGDRFDRITDVLGDLVQDDPLGDTDTSAQGVNSQLQIMIDKFRSIPSDLPDPFRNWTIPTLPDTSGIPASVASSASRAAGSSARILPFPSRSGGSPLSASSMNLIGTSAGSQTQTFVVQVYMNGRHLADALVPEIPTTVRHYGLGPR